VGTIFGACIGRVDVSIANPPPSFSSFGLDVDAMTNFAAGDVQINTVRVDTSVSGFVSCGLRLTANQVNITGDYSLDPDAVDPTMIDVNLMGQPGVSFTNFNDEFTSGICDFPLIGDLIQAIIGDIQPTVTNGLRDFLADPDGGGPLDAPIAEGIETALADISIAGPIGQSLGAILEAPLFSVVEDNAGITLGSDSSFVADCTPPAGAPDLQASYHVDEPFPLFGTTTPVGALPYDLAMAVSSSAFNQLLKAQVECGLLLATLTEVAIGGLPSQPITSDFLALFVPQFGVFPVGTPMRIELQPTVAPVVTGAPGPRGELAELLIGQLTVTIVEESTNTTVLSGHVDVGLGLDLTLDTSAGTLVFALATPAPGDVTVSITTNDIGADVPALEQFVLPGVIASLLPELAGSLGEFPLPTFLDLQLAGVEVSKNGQFMSLYADLLPAP
jgi:hypothetical protein